MPTGGWFYFFEHKYELLYCMCVLAGNEDNFLKGRQSILHWGGDGSIRNDGSIVSDCSSISCVSGVVRIIHWLSRTLFSNCGNVVENHTYQCHMPFLGWPRTYEGTGTELWASQWSSLPWLVFCSEPSYVAAGRAQDQGSANRVGRGTRSLSR